MCGKIGGSAWTAKSQDFSQFLTIDLGEITNVTGIATQGRNSPKEYVMEYAISYGSNGLDYADYREIDGSTKVSPQMLILICLLQTYVICPTLII